MAQSDGRLTLVLVTHDAKVAEVACDSVTVPAAAGYLTVLPGHTALVATLGPGQLGYQDRGQRTAWVVDAGFCEISNDVVTVLADSARLPSEVDVAAAEEAKREAEEGMLSAEEEQVEEARRRLAVAEARIEAGRSGG